MENVIIDDGNNLTRDWVKLKQAIKKPTLTKMKKKSPFHIPLQF